jgi:hypothetical protein
VYAIKLRVPACGSPLSNQFFFSTPSAGYTFAAIVNHLHPPFACLYFQLVPPPKGVGSSVPKVGFGKDLPAALKP